MNDPRTWTAVWELTMVTGVGVMGGGGQREKIRDNCNRITIKMILKRNYKLRALTDNPKYSMCILEKSLCCYGNFGFCLHYTANYIICLGSP